MSDALSQQFKALYDEWGAAIANHDGDWIERHLADDFHGTAQPWPTLSVNKKKMIELDAAIETMEVEWVYVSAKKLGDVVLTTGVVHYTKEVFKADAVIAEGMPSGQELSALVNGRMALYVNGWRHNGSHWQIFDHHMVGTMDGSSLPTS